MGRTAGYSATKTEAGNIRRSGSSAWSSCPSSVTALWRSAPSFAFPEGRTMDRLERNKQTRSGHSLANVKLMDAPLLTRPLQRSVGRSAVTMQEHRLRFDRVETPDRTPFGLTHSRR